VAVRWTVQQNATIGETVSLTVKREKQLNHKAKPQNVKTLPISTLF
jgi:hypothetical protein